MDALIGGVSSLHRRDPLLAAALRGFGVSAVALPTPCDEDLEAGRRCSRGRRPTLGLYLVGAVLRQLRAMATGRGCTLAEVVATARWCACRGGTFTHASQHREAWRAAGIPPSLSTAAVEFGRLDALTSLAGQLQAPDARVVPALLGAAVAGDALRLAGCLARAQWEDAPVDEALARFATGAWRRWSVAIGRGARWRRCPRRCGGGCGARGRACGCG